MKFTMGENLTHHCLLVIVAMDVEEAAVIEALGAFESWRVSEALNLTAKIFRKGHRSLVLARSGIGLANAAATTALILEKRPVDGIILFGVAGAITENLQIGDLVVATSIIQHDSLFSGEQGFELMAPGCLFVTAALREVESPIFKTDGFFRDWLRTEFAGRLSYFEGAMISGSEFVGSGTRKAELSARHPGSLAVEMEAAGIAVIAKKAGLPFGVLKTIADRLNPDHSVFHDFNAFVKSASDHAARVIQVLWENWSNEK
jgi:adenosylhomocysteine nucleosidase